MTGATRVRPLEAPASGTATHHPSPVAALGTAAPSCEAGAEPDGGDPARRILRGVVLGHTRGPLRR